MSASGAQRAAQDYDIAVVGAGIVGLAHALAAARTGLRAVVIERNPRADGASIRNFGFITVTGQPREIWALARRSRDVWGEVAPQAGIAIEHRGLVLLARRPEALDAIEAFLATDMGEGCELIDTGELERRYPELPAPQALGALVSPHELRVDSPRALPRLTSWLAHEHGVAFRMAETVLEVDPPLIRTSRGEVRAERTVVCAGDDFSGLFPERIEGFGLRRCRLSMLQLASPGFSLPAGIMSDLGLGRYRGYADLPEAEPLKRRLEAEQPRHLANGVHLIAVQNADGSLVVGDSHHYDDLPEPFAPAEAEALILDEFRKATGLEPPPVLARWTGTYAVSDGRSYVVDAPSPRTRLVIVTSGTGASTAFAIAERTIAELCGTSAPAGASS